jgi:hypothetical protein
MAYSATEPPVLLAYPTERGNWRVWCSHCNRWHLHGAEPGHRAAHCIVPGSPYRPGGYILKLAEVSA